MDAKRYNNVKLAIGISETVVTFFLLGFSVLFGWTKELEMLTREITGNVYFQFLLFTLLLGLVFSVLFFPLSFYSEYYLEHKYNLSNQSIGRWLWEKLKGNIVGGVIGIPLLLLFFYLIRVTGENWWVYFATVLFFFSVIMAQIAPVIILPLFYKIIPIDNEDLKTVIRELGNRAGLTVENVYKFNMSKNTKKANAAFTGLGKTKRIILGDTLLENFSQEEIETVIAHEMGHYKKKHIIKNIMISTISSFLVLFIVAKLYSASLVMFNFSSPAEIAAIPLLALWGMLIGLITTPISNAISRKFEYEADSYAVHETKKPEIFINTLNKLNEQNLGDKEPHPFVEWFFYSHPSIKKRIEYISSIKI